MPSSSSARMTRTAISPRLATRTLVNMRRGMVSGPRHPVAFRRVMHRRPHLALLGHSASPTEAAAVIAAVEQFLRDTLPPVVPPAPPRDAWIRAGLLEGAGHDPDGPM